VTEPRIIAANLREDCGDHSPVKKPIDIRCPKCSAAPTAKCLEKQLHGSKFMREFHQERIDAAAKESK
jgi:hypothetical protein